MFSGERREKNHNVSKNDKGSTLITVIVAIAFVTILTSIILGTTAVNVRMKGIDKRTKDDFYYAERALNDIYTGLGQELAKKAANRYEEVFEKVGDAEEVDFNQAENAEKEFRKSFAKDAYGFFPINEGDPTNAAIVALLNKYITSSAREESVEKVGGVEYQKKDGSAITSTITDDILRKDVYRVAVKDVRVSAKDSSGYRSVITTDIVINIPTVDFLGTNVDVSDYSIIANQGLYIEGSDTTKINGNVYAGVHTTPISGVDSDYEEINDEFAGKITYGGININGTNAEFKGNYIVSKGDINLAGSDPRLKVYLDSAGGYLPNLWCTSIRTLKSTSITDVPVFPISNPTIDVQANTFALNDLILNADNSSAVFKGNYYGYNDKTLPTPLAILDGVSSRDDNQSSAIIINGNRAALDMSGVNTFVLMGKAYIDFTSDSVNTDPSGTPEQVVPTAEGVALKTNQQLYLVPPDFLDGPNPAVGGQPGTSEQIKFKLNTTLNSDWFGLKYLDYGANISTPNLDSIHTAFYVKQKKINPGDPDVWVYYDYLNFNDKVWMPTFGADGKINGYRDEPDDTGVELGTGGSISSKQKFFYDIMTASNDPVLESKTQPSAWRLKQRIDLSIVNTSNFDLKGCTIGSASENAHFYSKNAVVNYERINDTTIQSNFRGNTDGMYRYAKYPQHLFRRYKWLCTKLDGKEDYPFGEVAAPGGEALPGELPDITDNDEWTDPAKNAPIRHFVKLVNVKTSIDNIGNFSEANSPAVGLKSGAYGTVIVKKMTESKPTLKLNDTTEVPSNAIISGTTFKGVAIVDGNIEVPANMKVRGLLMATGTITLKGGNEINYDKGLIQSRIEKEMNVVKNDASATYKDYYLINYLTESDGSTLLYSVEPGSKIKRDRIEADYNEFMHYENWQKGEK